MNNTIQKIQSVAHAALLQIDVLIPSWLPDAKREGGDWIALNPTRHDSNAGSFRITRSNGRWRDAATSDGGGDLVSLYAYIHGLARQIDAAIEVAQQVGLADLFSANYSPLDAAVRLKKLADEAAQRKAQAERERLEMQQAVRAKAQEMWGRSNRANPQHPYLVDKQVQPFNLRQYKDVLMVPLVDEHGLANIQFIQADGEKRFLKGGKAKGVYCPIGTIEGATALYICEGWATGASVHALTGAPVACAMNVGNLLPVAQMMRTKYPTIHICIAGDNDTNATPNAGAKSAHEAALAVRGEVMLPEFPKGHNGTDWNDWHRMQKGGAA